MTSATVQTVEPPSRFSFLWSRAAPAPAARRRSSSSRWTRSRAEHGARSSGRLLALPAGLAARERAGLGRRTRRAARLPSAERGLSGLDERAGAVSSALADPARREIVRLLSEQGPQTQTQLARRLSVTRQAVAKHLSALSGAGLVEASRDGRETRYRLTPEPFEAAALWMAALGARCDRRLEALRRRLEGR